MTTTTTLTSASCPVCGGPKLSGLGEIQVHAGDCPTLGPKLGAATDNQLHAELERRRGCAQPRFGGAQQVAAVLASANDDELRAECERRFAGPVNEYTRLSLELDGFKKMFHEAADQRDEWKRRAEAAEQRLKFDPATQMVPLMEVRRREETLRLKLRQQYLGEAGPGIDPRPDNSISHLPEDLLADDAD